MISYSALLDWRLVRFDLIVFDLDGTLIDSKLDLALSVNAARNHAGMPPLDHDLIYSYVGNGALTLIRRSLGLEASQKQVDSALKFFYEYYQDHMLDNTVLYPGVQQVLDVLSNEKCILAILTNKPVHFSSLLVEKLDLTNHFRHIYGGNSFHSKKPDPHGLNHLMAELATPKDRTLMVGDSAVDVQTARNAGTVSCGVTYGLQPETLVDDPPEILVDDIHELVAIVTNDIPSLSKQL